MNAGAITDDASFGNDADTSSGSGIDIADITVTEDGGNVLITGEARLKTGVNNPGRIRLFRGNSSTGTIIKTVELPGASGIVGMVMPWMHIDTAPVGAQLYTANYVVDSGATVMNFRTMIGWGLKR